MAVLLERKPASSVHGTEDSRSVPPRRHADHHAARRGRSASGFCAPRDTYRDRTPDQWTGTGPGTTGAPVTGTGAGAGTGTGTGTGTGRHRYCTGRHRYCTGRYRDRCRCRWWCRYHRSGTGLSVGMYPTPCPGWYVVLYL